MRRAPPAPHAIDPHHPGGARPHHQPLHPAGRGFQATEPLRISSPTLERLDGDGKPPIVTLLPQIDDAATAVIALLGLTWWLAQRPPARR